MTQKFFSLVLIVLALTLVLVVGGCSKHNPTEPPADNPTKPDVINSDDGVYIASDEFVVIYHTANFYFCGKICGIDSGNTAYIYAIRASSCPPTWREAYFTSTWNGWKFDDTVFSRGWYVFRMSVGKESMPYIMKFNITGGAAKWPPTELMRAWYGKFFGEDIVAKAQLGSAYGGDGMMRLYYLDARIPTQAELDVAFYSKEPDPQHKLVIGVQIINQIKGVRYYIDSNLSGTRRAYRPDETFVGVPANGDIAGGDIAVGDGNGRVRFRMIIDGVVQPEYVYNITVQERSNAQWINLSPVGTTNQNNAPSDGQFQFTVTGLSKFQSPETGFDVKRELYSEEPGSEWVAISESRILNVPKATAEGRHEYILGIFRSDLPTATITDPVGNTKKLSNCTVLDWFEPAVARVKFEFDANTGAIK